MFSFENMNNNILNDNKRLILVNTFLWDNQLFIPIKSDQPKKKNGQF